MEVSDTLNVGVLRVRVRRETMACLVTSVEAYTDTMSGVQFQKQRAYI